MHRYLASCSVCFAHTSVATVGRIIAASLHLFRLRHYIRTILSRAQSVQFIGIDPAWTVFFVSVKTLWTNGFNKNRFTDHKSRARFWGHTDLYETESISWKTQNVRANQTVTFGLSCVFHKSWVWLSSERGEKYAFGGVRKHFYTPV